MNKNLQIFVSTLLIYCGQSPGDTGSVPLPLPLCKAEESFCSQAKRCIPNAWICDGEQDCDNGEDEVACENCHEAPDKFQCGDGTCISLAWRCDKIRDCFDFSDEIGCPRPAETPTP